MYRALFILALLVLLIPAGCKKASGPIENLLGGKIRVIGHAGIGFESVLTPFPSNSLGSIRRVIEGYNADGVEVDVQITKDSVPVLAHDQQLEMMTDCYGNVVDYTVPELRSCRYRTDFNSHILQDEAIITLEDLLARYAGTAFDPWVYLDIKFPREWEYPDPEIRKSLMRAVDNLSRNYGMGTKMAAASSELLELNYLQQLNPDIELHYDHHNFEEALERVLQHNLHGIVISNNNVSKEQIKRAHEKGIQVVIFGVALRNDIVDAVNKHPDVIQTDNIILLQQILTH